MSHETTKKSVDALNTTPQVPTDEMTILCEADAAENVTRSGIAPMLATVRADADEMEPTLEEVEEIERRIQILSGDGYLKQGNLDAARKAYAAARVEIPTKKYLACAGAELEEGWFDRVREVYASALFAEKLIFIGDRAASWHNPGSMRFESALRSFWAAGAKEKLVALGDTCLKEQQPDRAREAYAAAAKLGAGN